MRHDRRLSGITVVGAALLTVVLGLASYAEYPHRFSPAANWFSDLGDTSLNPRGAPFFRLDMIVVGVGLAVFFAGLGRLRPGLGGRTRPVLAVAQVAGLVAALAATLSGLFSENQEAAHALWASTLYVTLAVAVGLTGWVMFRHPEVPARLAGLAFVTGASDAVAVAARRHWLEWVAVPLLLVFVAVASLATVRVASVPRPSDGLARLARRPWRRPPRGTLPHDAPGVGAPGPARER